MKAKSKKAKAIKHSAIGHEYCFILGLLEEGIDQVLLATSNDDDFCDDEGHTAFKLQTLINGLNNLRAVKVNIQDMLYSATEGGAE